MAFRAGRYIRQAGGFKAFVPAPLPPAPPVQIAGPLRTLLPEADYALGRLDGAVMTLPNPDRFVFMYVRREAIQSLYTKHAMRAWITGLLGEPDAALAQLEHDGFIWRDTRRWDHYGIAAMPPGWIERRFAEAGLIGLATRRGECNDTNSYKVGRKPR